MDGNEFLRMNSLPKKTPSGGAGLSVDSDIEAKRSHLMRVERLLEGEGRLVSCEFLASHQVDSSGKVGLLPPPPQTRTPPPNPNPKKCTLELNFSEEIPTNPPRQAHQLGKYQATPKKQNQRTLAKKFDIGFRAL